MQAQTPAHKHAGTNTGAQTCMQKHKRTNTCTQTHKHMPTNKQPQTNAQKYIHTNIIMQITVCVMSVQFYFSSCKLELLAFSHSNWNILRCCNNCPRDDSPRRQLSKGILSNDTVVQGDYCPMGLLSKEAFTSEKLVQINFSYFLLEVTTFIDYRISKKK